MQNAKKKAFFGSIGFQKKHPEKRDVSVWSVKNVKNVKWLCKMLKINAIQAILI